MNQSIPFSKSPLDFKSPSSEAANGNGTMLNGISTQHKPIPAAVYTSLPTLRAKSHFLEPVDDDIDTFLTQDQDVSRITRIYDMLWMAGRPMPARPLTRLNMIGLDVIPTDQADLHLLKVPKRIFVKPLPVYLLCAEFWSRYLCGKSNETLHRQVTGFLVSYVWLIRSELDLKIARELSLVPEELEWVRWKEFVSDFTSRVDVNVLDEVDKRYHFGELRLGRINTIYRLRYFHTNFVRGYLYEYNRYVIFFERNFGWLLGVFVYFSIILSAMQVGSSIPPLSTSHTFQRAAYGFVAFSIVAVVAFMVFVAVVFSAIYLFNMVQAIGHPKRAKADREKYRVRGRGSKIKTSSEIC